jgi:hypothetical protein
MSPIRRAYTVRQCPGFAKCDRRKPVELDIAYADVPNGGRITYTAHTPALVDAVHRWFDAQVSDHGRDAHAGH